MTDFGHMYIIATSIKHRIHDTARADPGREWVPGSQDHSHSMLLGTPILQEEEGNIVCMHVILLSVLELNNSLTPIL